MLKKLVIVFFSLVFTSLAWGESYIEEVSTLESIYESRARAALNTLLRPDEYSLVVSAEINRDAKKIEKYRDEIDRTTLPGMPAANGEHLGIAANELDALKSGIQVHLVINSDVDENREQMISQILRSKLHLDTDLGDKIIIQRAKFPGEKVRIPAEVGEPLPEPGFKLMGLLAFIALALLATAAFFIKRKKEKSEELKHQHMAAPSPFDPYNRPDEANESTETAEQIEDASLTGDEVFLSKIEQNKEQIYSMSKEFPYLVVTAASDYFKQGNEQDLMILFNTLGWDPSRRMFKSLPEKIWAKLGFLVETNNKEFKIREISGAVDRSCRFILSKVLSFGKFGDEHSPFSFLFDLRSSERKLLLASESADKLSVVGFCSSDEEFAEILQDLDIEKQQEIIAFAAKVGSLPETVIQQTADYFLEKVESTRGKREVEADGPSKAAKILRMLPPEQEEVMFSHFVKNNPEQAENIRRKIIRFNDLAIVPQSVLENTFGGMDIDEVVTALARQPTEFTEFILRFIPAKKAKVINGDLQFRGSQVSDKDRAKIQRKICLKIETALRSKGVTVQDLWEDRRKSI